MSAKTACTAMILAVFSFGSPVTAQEEPSSPPAATEPRPIRFHMMDGSVLIGHLQPETMKMETEYGTLTVPSREIIGFTPGLSSKPELKQKVDSLIAALGDGGFEEREKAQKELISIGLPIRELVRAHRKDRDVERRTRIGAVLKEIDEMEGDFYEEFPGREPETWIEPDELRTDSFTMKGNLLPKEFEITGSYGHRLTLRMNHVRMAEREAPEEDVELRVNVTDAHFVQKDFKETGIRLEAGDRVRITADGTLTMTPWNSTSGPDGGSNFGAYDKSSQIFNGALVGRIGASGDLFKIGSKHNFTVRKPGTLQLAITMHPSYAGNHSFPGGYKVKIHVDRAD